MLHYHVGHVTVFTTTRRLCILKGVYPVEPRHKKKVNHGSTAHRTYYFAKDILFLSHEPLLEKFREFKVFVKKLTRAIHKGEIHSADKLVENKPVYTLDHVIKERCGIMWTVL